MFEPMIDEAATAGTRPLRPVRLRAVDPSLTRLGRRVGAGLCAEVMAAGVPLLLEASGPKRAGPGGPPSPLVMHTPAGALAFTPSREIVRLLTAIDVPAEDHADPLRQLRLDVATQSVPPEWMSLFGASTFLFGEHEGSGLAELSLTIRQPGTRLALAASVRGSSEALAHALAQPAWRRAATPATPLPPGWTLEVPVCIGLADITLRECRSLEAGDVVIVTRPCFDFDDGLAGQGELRIGSRVARCTLDAGNQTLLRFTEWHPTTTGANMTQPLAQPPLHANPPDDDGVLDDVPVTLSFEMGAVALTLSELKSLAPGSVLSIAGALPPQVSICAGGHRIGNGELVELDGRLGVEIRRIGASS